MTLEDNVFIGPNVTFTNDLIPRSKVYPKEFSKTFIKRYASIGANSTIIAGNTIGEYAFIGSGSVVTKDIPPYSVWYGNPAKHKGFITKEGVILNLSLVDKKSGKKYIYTNNEIQEMINFLDLQSINKQHNVELTEAFKRVLDSGWYIMGK